MVISIFSDIFLNLEFFDSIPCMMSRPPPAFLLPLNFSLFGDGHVEKYINKILEIVCVC